MPSFRSSASFGKRQEFVAIAELMKRNYDVYLTLVEDQQIDCILRLERDPYPVYVDIQIKARSKGAKNPGTFAAMEIRKPRPNFYFIFYSEAANQYWIMPSIDVTEVGDSKQVRDSKRSLSDCFHQYQRARRSQTAPEMGKVEE